MKKLFHLPKLVDKLKYIILRKERSLSTFEKVKIIKDMSSAIIDLIGRFNISKIMKFTETELSKSY